MTPLKPYLSAGAVLLLAACNMEPGKDHPRLRETVSFQENSRDPMVEGKRSMRGYLTIKRQKTTKALGAGEITRLEIDGPWGQALEASLPEGGLVGYEFDPNKRYRVDLLTHIHGERGYISNDVLRISDGRRVILDTSVCAVHYTGMTRQLPEGRSAEDYGAYHGSFYGERNRRFPNDGNAYVACGSWIPHPVWKCSGCEKAYHRWARGHGIESNSDRSDQESAVNSGGIRKAAH